MNDEVNQTKEEKNEAEGLECNITNDNMKNFKLFEPQTKCKLKSNHSECFYMNKVIIHARMVVFIYFIFMSIGKYIK